MRSWLRKIYDRSPLLRRVVRSYRAAGSAYPDWKRLLARDRGAWGSALQAAREGPPVLIATSVGSFLPGVGLESLLAVALTLRGARVHVLLCDAALPACMEARYNWHPRPDRLAETGIVRDLCRDCFAPAARTYGALGLPLHRYGESLTEADRKEADEISRTVPADEIGRYRREGQALGEAALAGALRFYARGSLDGEPEGEAVLRQYFKAALLTSRACNSLMDKVAFRSAVFHHGIYVPQGVVGEVARARKVPVVNWNPAYRKGCFIFSHGNTYHHTLMDEPVDQWANLPWSEEMERRTLDYLESRKTAAQDWIWFHERSGEDADARMASMGIDRSRPCIGLLTNVAWDAQLHYPANVFPNMSTWLRETVAYFSRRPELQLIVRVHPGEVRSRLPSRQPIEQELRKSCSPLPPNVFIVPAESPASTYDLMERCDSVLIYGTKTGVELASRGIPVIVAGEAWIRNKGLTQDATSRAGYFEILDRLPLGRRMSAEEVTRARKYAYHFFFRRMIPLEGLRPVEGAKLFELDFPSLESLGRGRNRSLDVLCDGILEEKPFVYPAERVETSSRCEQEMP